jgi:ATP synthase protein I
MSDEISKLSERIKQAQLVRRDAPESIEQGTSDPETQKEMSLSMRLSMELLAGLITGGIIGYFFDYIFNTMPLFLIIFLLLGACAGFWTVYKLAFTNKDVK